MKKTRVALFITIWFCLILAVLLYRLYSKWGGSPNFFDAILVILGFMSCGAISSGLITLYFYHKEILDRSNFYEINYERRRDFPSMLDFNVLTNDPVYSTTVMGVRAEIFHNPNSKTTTLCQYCEERKSDHMVVYEKQNGERCGMEMICNNESCWINVGITAFQTEWVANVTELKIE